jgi:hypothetical protein
LDLVLPFIIHAYHCVDNVVAFRGLLRVTNAEGLGELVRGEWMDDRELRLEALEAALLFQESAGDRILLKLSSLSSCASNRLGGRWAGAISFPQVDPVIPVFWINILSSL